MKRRRMTSGLIWRTLKARKRNLTRKHKNLTKEEGPFILKRDDLMLKRYSLCAYWFYCTKSKSSIP